MSWRAALGVTLLLGAAAFVYYIVRQLIPVVRDYIAWTQRPVDDPLTRSQERFGISYVFIVLAAIAVSSAFVLYFFLAFVYRLIF